MFRACSSCGSTRRSLRRMIRLTSPIVAGGTCCSAMAIRSLANASGQEYIGEQLVGPAATVAYRIHRADHVLELHGGIGPHDDLPLVGELLLHAGDALGEAGPIVGVASPGHRHHATARGGLAARRELAPGP